MWIACGGVAQPKDDQHTEEIAEEIHCSRDSPAALSENNVFVARSSGVYA